MICDKVDDLLLALLHVRQASFDDSAHRRSDRCVRKHRIELIVHRFIDIVVLRQSLECLLTPGDGSLIEIRLESPNTSDSCHLEARDEVEDVLPNSF